MTLYTLNLSFDLRQVTQSLAYEFTLKDNSVMPKNAAGPLAGTFNFQKGDEICVQVTANSAARPTKQGATAKDILETFKVINCTFMSIPARMTEALSMFETSNASASVEDWDVIFKTSSAADEEKRNLKSLCQRSPSPLSVVTKTGQWQISGYLSVELTTKDGVTRPQLYFFDPEGSAGDGGGWGP